jgi:hypothetical protein
MRMIESCFEDIFINQDQRELVDCWLLKSDWYKNYLPTFGVFFRTYEQNTSYFDISYEIVKKVDKF